MSKDDSIDPAIAALIDLSGIPAGGLTVPDAWHIFLGGADLEMMAIRALLRHGLPAAAQHRIVDRDLAWGAKVSDYRAEVDAVLAGGGIAVLIELAEDMVIPRHRVIIIDHHGPLAGAQRPTALEQVFSLIAAPAAGWSRGLALISANDRGHIPALRELGADQAEILTVRRADWRAQGITDADEAAARAAARSARQGAGGRLTVCSVPDRRWVSVVADVLLVELGGPGYVNLLVTGASTLSFFGDGGCIAALDQAFPGGWSGGALPQRGYWGAPATPLLAEQAEALLTRRLLGHLPVEPSKPA